MSNNRTIDKTVRQRLLTGVLQGRLGTAGSGGVIVTTEQFRHYFSELNTLYRTSFLPAAVIEAGRCGISHTKYLTRLSRGVYLIHEEALIAHARVLKEEGECFNEDILQKKSQDVPA